MKKTALFSFIVLISYATHSQTLIDSLIGYWPFNGSAIDESNHHNDGVTFGPALTTDRFGIENSAYYFDGIDDFIEIIPSSDVSEIRDFTLALWMYCDKYTIQSPLGGMLDRQFIFEGGSNSNTVSSDFHREGIRVMLDYTAGNDEQLHNSIIYDQVDVVNNLLATNISSNLTEDWHFIVFTREYDQDRTYLNGQLLESTYSSFTKRSDPLNMQHPWYIGSGFGNNPYYNIWNYSFEGKIDDIRFYIRAIDSVEVKSLFNEFDLDDKLSDSKIVIHIYPNPARNKVYIRFVEGFMDINGYKLRIMNSLSQIVFEDFIINQEITLDAHYFETLGLYYVQIIDHNNKVLKTSKLLIQ